MKTTLECFTVYKDPIDYPGKYVVRKFSIVSGLVVPLPDAEARVFDTLSEARQFAAKPGLVRLERHPSDDKPILEMWL